MDCVVYLHTHSATRIQGNFLREWMVLKGKALLVFDFHGAGQSDGKYVTFGYFETLDLDAVGQVCYLGGQIPIRHQKVQVSQPLGPLDGSCCSHYVHE